MDRDFLIDLFAGFGPVSIRRMFSGYGISADGTNFALALRGGLYLRADDGSIPDFEREGSTPFVYETRGRTVTVRSYWQLPVRLYDDPDELAQWARTALAAAERAALAKPRRPRSRSRASVEGREGTVAKARAKTKPKTKAKTKTTPSPRAGSGKASAPSNKAATAGVAGKKRPAAKSAIKKAKTVTR